MKESEPTQDTTANKLAFSDIVLIIKNLLADMAHLVVIETKLFGHTLLAMIWISLIIALLLLGGWLFTGAALAMALASLQVFNLTSALLMVAFINLVLATLAIWRLRYITRDLTFRESRASLNNLVSQAQCLAVPAEPQRPQEE
ncbi:hypothetical protein LH51_00285 [Nitrincola sp. A-D6]|uniref:hypothetical protein n=1 Tax=Nitrincola sp. A-D6 TaxID=1545442 RepID=UPI00051FBC52|nr:hypothetical protein [Nitrincola sp. A-D6]KGK43391.1 hypothetical protein LH51_00285 [Nitrincola sp. A-D6]